jgi:hypothetical protein
MTIDWSDDFENAHDSIRVHRDGDSNNVDESERHSEKHDEQRISTLHKTLGNWSDDFQSVYESICVYGLRDSNGFHQSKRHIVKRDDDLGNLISPGDS